MELKLLSRGTAVAAFAGFALVFATACGPNNNNTDEHEIMNPNPAADTAEPSASNAEGQPITLTACLQQNDSGDYIATEMNEPTTGGAPATGNKVAREQLAEARHAYKLNGDEDELDGLLGKQVTVHGTIAEKSDVVQTVHEDRTNLDAGDLTAVDVTSVEQTQGTCGTESGSNAAPHPSGSGSANRSPNR